MDYMILIGDKWIMVKNWLGKEIFLSKVAVAPEDSGDAVQILSACQFPVNQLVILAGGHGDIDGAHGGHGTRGNAELSDDQMILRETMAFADVVHQVVDVRQATFWIDGYLYNSPEDAVIASTRPMIVDWCYSACMDLKMDIGLLASVRLQLPGELRQQILALRNMRRNRPV